MKRLSLSLPTNLLSLQTAAGLLVIACCQMIRADEDQTAVDRPAKEKEWNVVFIDGLTHVSVKNIEAFYQFHSLKEEGDDWTLQYFRACILKGRVGIPGDPYQWHHLPPQLSRGQT